MFCTIFRVDASCESLLSGAALPLFWISFFALLITITILAYYSATNPVNLQTYVTVHALLNLFVMFILNLLVIILHYKYGLNYPLHRSDRSGRFDAGCITHSILSSISCLIPSSTLMFLTITHYRAVFWASFEYKLEVKHIIRPALVFWFAT